LKGNKMNTALKPNLENYGYRFKINLKLIAYALTVVCFVVPVVAPFWLIPFIHRTFKGNMYIARWS